MKSMNNTIELVGTLEGPLQFDHQVMSEKFLRGTIKTDRLSGNSDYLPILVSERLLTHKQYGSGDRVKIEGQIRSYNKIIDERMRLILKVFVTHIDDATELEDSLVDKNECTLRGFLCKDPNLRITPKSRTICDIMLATNRDYNKSDYIPIILWNRNADYVASMSKGTQIIINGRFQSRVYNKNINGEEVAKTAYEVSANSVELVTNDGMSETVSNG